MEPMKTVKTEDRVYLPSMMTKILHISCYNGRRPVEALDHHSQEHSTRIILTETHARLTALCPGLPG